MNIKTLRLSLLALMIIDFCILWWEQVEQDLGGSGVGVGVKLRLWFNLWEKSRGQKFNCVFEDLEKAFDRVLYQTVRSGREACGVGARHV